MSEIHKELDHTELPGLQRVTGACAAPRPGDPLQLMRRLVRPSRIQGSVIEAPLTDVAIGEICQVRASLEGAVVGRAQVVGLTRDGALLAMLGGTAGLSRRAVLVPTGAGMRVDVSAAMLGTVVNAAGEIVERLCPPIEDGDLPARRMPLDAAPLDYSMRRSVERPLETGIRAIDGLLTCGIGQRIGIFAAAGVGKSALLTMLIEHAAADVQVVALIGERGREVTEFVERLKRSDRCATTVVVYSTSDSAAVDRCNAAHVATTIAEYFRDAGRNVMLFVDSMTRYARARRAVALATGEPPARRGYPASVFEDLPRLLERAGCSVTGSITAFYTVLLEHEDEPDPVGDEIRSILDGHLYLSGRLAARRHFPAIDLLASASRLADSVRADGHRQAATRCFQLLARIESLEPLVELGEYRRGEDSGNDDALDRRERIDAFVRQAVDETSTFETTLARLHEVTA
ncbi:FliI/YscN family ATPase [Burkholderia sp. BE17]|nr:FliI/YscN family ATPase [Burkholderia sp. BE17]